MSNKVDKIFVLKPYPPEVCMVDYPSGQESRRKRRALERKIKKKQKLF